MLWEEHMAAEAEAAGDHAGARYWHSLKALVDQAPPLSEEQRSQLRILLRPVPAAEHIPQATFRNAA
jgi:hypothetical protein